MAKLIKGYYKDGVWHEYGGKLYDTIGYNTNGSMTQKAISDTLGGVLELIGGYSMAIRVHGDASVTNLNPFYFVTDGESFTITITYNQPAIALNVISIIMDGTDITQEAYQDGIISIDRVTGNVVITVETASVTDETMFTKRTTANGLQVLNDKALLKRVQGNSLQFQQRVITYNFSGGSLGNWLVDRGTYTITDGILCITGPSNNTPYIHIKPNENPIFTAAHKYFVAAKFRVTDLKGANRTFYLASNASSIVGKTVSDSNWYVFGGVKTFATAPTGNGRWLCCYIGSGAGTSFDLEWVQCFDLTLLGAEHISSYAEFIKYFPNMPYPYNSSAILLNNSMTNYVSKDGNEETLQNVSLNVPTLTGKLNGEGESAIIFPNGMKSSCNEAVNDTYDEIKQVDGVWTAIKRIGTERATSAISGRGEYEILAQEEVYVLDDQTIPTEITVADQGVEEILPANGATPTTAPAIMEIQYGAIPSRGLLGGLLGGTKGGSSNEPDYSDGEEITDYEEEQETNEDSDELKK
jgi:hypothetical protein